MKKSKFRSFRFVVLVFVLCFLLPAGCSGQQLSDDFDKDEVKKAAETVVELINAQDSKGILAICTVQMKDALTDDVLAKIYEAIGEGGNLKKSKK